jgi:predicted transglutaminase-like protease
MVQQASVEDEREKMLSQIHACIDKLKGKLQEMKRNKEKRILGQAEEANYTVSLHMLRIGSDEILSIIDMILNEIRDDEDASAKIRETQQPILQIKEEVIRLLV